MTAEKLNTAFDIALEEMEDMIGMPITGDLTGYDRIVSPRDIVKVNGMTFFREDVFYSLVRRIPLRSEKGLIYPYEDSKIQIFRREPKGTDIGQTFILRDKLISIMEGLERGIFEEFSAMGISKMPPVQIYGLDREGRKVLAFYVPPIVEIHNNAAVMIDGIHRSRLCSGAGTTINAIHISNVSVPLPFEPLTWKEAKLVIEKPPIEKRYQNLRTDYFRDLGRVGIDG